LLSSARREFTDSVDEGIEVVNEIKLDLFSFTKYGKPEKVHEMFKENVTLSGLEEGSEEDVKEATKIKDDSYST
jgi:hypothetical protein